MIFVHNRTDARNNNLWGRSCSAAAIATAAPLVVGSGVVGAALEMMIAAGIIEQPEPKTMTTWDGPSWRASAKDYHEQRASRRTSETISPERLAHLCRRHGRTTFLLIVHGTNSKPIGRPPRQQLTRSMPLVASGHQRTYPAQHITAAVNAG